MGSEVIPIFTDEKAQKLGKNTKDLRVIENDLVPVYETSTGEKVVYGTELHEVLEVKSNYREWIKRRIIECDAIENGDYATVEIPTVSGGTPKKEHIIKLDAAKEMAMLERNEKGKQVRRYFIQIEKKYKEKDVGVVQSAFILCLQGVKFVADDLKVSESSKLLMYNGAFEEFGLPTSFLPKYEDNGSRERCSATCLLKRYGCNMSATKFNQLLLKKGYLEERERLSSNGKTKKFKALTEKGLEYGANLISEKNQKEVQPYYYEDTFMELFEFVQ